MLGVIVGGVIGTASSLLTALCGDALASRKDRATLLQGKLEETYQNTLSLKMWNDRAVHAILMTWDRIIRPGEQQPEPTRWDEECPIVRIGMLVDLYFPDLSQAYSRLLAAENSLRHGFYEFLKGTTGTSHDMASFEAHLEKPQESLSREMEDFRKQLCERAKEIA
jgi:hypothetical protein